MSHRGLVVYLVGSTCTFLLGMFLLVFGRLVVETSPWAAVLTHVGAVGVSVGVSNLFAYRIAWKQLTLERVDIEEREGPSIIVSERAKGKGMVEALRASAGAWKGLVDAEELKKNIYADRLINTRPEPRL